MIENQPSSCSGMRPGRVSLLLGFSISFLCAISILAFGRHGIWQVVYLKMGTPLGALLVKAHQSVGPSLSPRIGMGPEILDALLTWGLFFSSMIYGYLSNKRFVFEGPASNHTKSDRLRMITTAILLLAAIAAAAGSFLNDYRAHSVCGLGAFQPAKAASEAASMGIPFALIAVFYWSPKSGKINRAVTLLVAIAATVICLYNSISDTITGYAPCDRKGDESSFNLFLFELLILFIWMALYGISTFIGSVRRKPSIYYGDPERPNSRRSNSFRMKP
jgi:hypothetical protein